MADSTTDETDDPDVLVGLTMHLTDTITLGMESHGRDPEVRLLVEVDEDEEKVIFKVETWRFTAEDVGDLADMLEIVAGSLRDRIDGIEAEEARMKAQAEDEDTD